MMGSVGSYDVCVWWGKPCLILLDIIFCPLMRSPWETPLLLPVIPGMRPYPEGPVQELQGHPPSEGRAGRNSSWSLWSSVVSYAPSSMTLNFSSALCLCVSSFLFFSFFIVTLCSDFSFLAWSFSFQFLCSSVNMALQRFSELVDTRCQEEGSLSSERDVSSPAAITMTVKLPVLVVWPSGIGSVDLPVTETGDQPIGFSKYLRPNWLGF